MNNRSKVKTPPNEAATDLSAFRKQPSGGAKSSEWCRETAALQKSGFGHNFGAIQVVGSSFGSWFSTRRSGAIYYPLRAQTKLKFGQPGDKYEQEADRMADQVMRMPEPRLERDQSLPCHDCDEEKQIQAKSKASMRAPVIQRQSAPEEEEEEETIQTKRATGQTPEVAQKMRTEINNLKGAGRPLSRSERVFFEPRFGCDFSQVRVHTDTRVAESASAINAKAYTLGSDVVFGAGQYFPDSFAGQKLLAHELTHVIQQNRGNNYSETSNYSIGKQENTGTMVQRQLISGSGHEESEKAVAEKQPGPVGLLLSLDGEQWELSFTEAISTIKNWTDAEIAAIKRHRKLNEDQWIVSFWSEVFGGVELPSPSNFGKVYPILKEAEICSKEALSRSDPNQIKDWLETAGRLLNLAAYLYNSAHEEWREYKLEVVAGAELAKRTIEIAIVVLSAAAGGVGGTIGRSPSILNYAVTQAVLTGSEKLATEIGRNIFLGEEFDIVEIIGKSASSFVSCLIGGKLAEKFFGKLVTTITASGITPPAIHEILTSRVGRYNVELLLNEVLNELRGQHPNGEDIIQRLVDKLVAIPVDTLTTWII
jgi:hypothetical protein